MQATPGEMKSFKSSAERIALIVAGALGRAPRGLCDKDEEERHPRSMDLAAVFEPVFFVVDAIRRK
jgi:hypothetical protein